MFRGLKNKLEKSLNQSGIITSLSKGNQSDDSSGNARSRQHGDETPVGSKLSSASTSLVDLSEEPANMTTPGPKSYQFHQSTPIFTEGQGDVVDHTSPAVLDLSNFESDDFTNVNSSNQCRTSRASQRSESNVNNNSAPHVGRSRNSSISSQMSDSYYFTPNSGFVPQSQTHSFSAGHQGPTSDVESVTSEFDDSNFARVADDRMTEPLSREDLTRFYEKMQLKNQKYTGRYSRVVAAYRDLEKERDRLKEVLAKCQDKSFQRINELKEQLSLKNMAMNDVEVNYTMMLQEKDEFIKVLQMQVNILKQKMDSEKLIDLDGGRSNPPNFDVESDAALLKEENVVLKEKVSKMSGLLSNCKASILKHREEIKELQNENQQLKRKTADDQAELETLKVKVDELVSEMKLQLEKQDANGSKLVRDFSLLQAEHEALGREAEEARMERNVLSSNLQVALNVRTTLEEKLELLNCENCQLRKQIDEISQKLQDKMKKEAAIIQWRDRIVDILDRTNRDRSARLPIEGAESDEAPDSSRSAAGSNSWFTTDTDQEESSVSGVSVSWCSPEIDDASWKELEQKLMNCVEGKSKVDVQDEDSLLSGRHDVESVPVVNSAPEDVLESLKSNLEKANKEKIDLIKSLSMSKMHTRIFRNLCECIFKAVLIKKNSDLHDNSVLTSKPVVDVGLDLNTNVNNNASDSETPENSIPSPSVSSIVAVDSSSVAKATPTCIPEKSDPFNPLKVTRSCGDQQDQDFSMRHSILTILKDGLGHTMKMLEDRKKKKRRELENIYHLSAAEDPEENAEDVLNRNSQTPEDLGQSLEKELCLKTKSKPSSSTPAPMLDMIQEDDEEWETVDEEEEEEGDCNDGSAGYIDDYETLFLGGERLKNSSIQKLLLNWKTGCERFEEDVGRSDRPLVYDGSECEPLDSIPNSNDSFQDQNLCLTAPLKDTASLQTAYESLKADQEKLLNDYDGLQKDFSANLRSLDELKEKNESISRACEKAQSDLELKVKDSKAVEEFLENAQNLNSELQRSLDSLRHEHLKLQQDLNDLTSENLRLTTEISESNEHFEQLQLDLSNSETRRSQLQDELRRHQLDISIKEQDYAELKDEHEKMLEELRMMEDSLKKNKENISKLNSEQQLLQEDHRNLLEECHRLKVSESDLQAELESLRRSRAGLEETQGKLQDSFAKSKQEATGLASELEEERKIQRMMVEDLTNHKDVCEQLKSERERLQKLVDELRIELSNHEVKEQSLQLEVDSLKKELEKEREEEGSNDSFLSNFEKTKSELATVREEFDKVQIQLEFLKGSLDKALDENSTLEEKLQTINEAQDEKTTRLASELKKKDEEIENLKNSQESKSSEASTRLEAKEKELQSLIDGLNEELERSQSEIKDLQASVEEVNAEKLKLETETDNLNGKLNTLRSSIDDLEQNNSLLLLDAESLKAANDLNLKECEAKHSQEIEISRKNLETSQAELTQLKSKLDSLQQDSMKHVDKEIQYEKELLGLKEEIQNKEKELISIREVLERERTEHARLNEETKQKAQNDRERAESSLLDLRREVTSLKEEKSTNESEMGRLKEQLNESQQQMDSLKSANKGLNVEVEVLKSKIEEKSLEFAGEFDRKTKKLEETWKNKLSKLESLRSEDLDKMKNELINKEASQTSVQEKLEREKAALENDLQTSTERIESLLSELDFLRVEKEMTKSKAASFESKIFDLEKEIEEERKNYKEKEKHFTEQIVESNFEVARLERLSSESKEKLDKIEKENLKNLQILDDIRVEREELEKCLNVLKDEKRLIESEGASLKETLEKSEERFKVLQSTLSSDKESLESKLAELTLEKERLTIELENVTRDHRKAFKEQVDLVDKMKAERIETCSKFEMLSDENVLLESSVEEQKTKVLQLNEELLKLAEINESLMLELETNKQHLTKSLAEADQRLLEFKESSEAEIKTVESRLESAASEEKRHLEREMTVLRESVLEKEKMVRDLEETLKTKETEWTNKMNELKKKAEFKLKQLRKQKDEAILSSEGRISELEKQLSDLKGKLLEKEANIESIGRSNDEHTKHLEDLLAKETAKFNSQVDRCHELESSLAESKLSLEGIQSLLRETQSRLHDNRSCLDDALTRLKEKQESEAEKSKLLDVANKEVEVLKAEILQLREDGSIFEARVEESDRNLREADARTKILERELELVRKTSEEEKSSSSSAYVEKLDSLEKKLSEIEKESETVKRKNQTLKLEVKRLRAENETSLKAAELDKNNEIERLKKEYNDEMNEREDNNSAKIKHLLKEFQVKLAEKEKEYQDQFVSSIEKFENENDLRAMDLESEVKELREELQEKEEFIDERCAKIEELTLQITQLRSAAEWAELMERNVKLESQINELQNKLEQELKIGETRKLETEDEDAPATCDKRQQLNGSQISLESSGSSVAPVEFEYLKAVLFKYMTDSADKHTLTRVICRIMKFSEVEEGRLMEQWKK